MFRPTRLLLLALVALLIPRGGVAQDRVEVDLVDELRPLMNIELGIIRRVCRPTPEQKPKIAAAAEKCLARMSDTVVGDEGDSASRETVAITPHGLRLSEDPIIRIQREMVTALRPLLSDQQHADYAKEVDQRRQFRRHTNVIVAVELLDQHLALADDQKAEITQKLIEGWDDAESVSMQMYVSNHQYIPHIPKSLVEPVLDGSQKSIWSSLNRTRFAFHVAQYAADVWDEKFMEAK